MNRRTPRALIAVVYASIAISIVSFVLALTSIPGGVVSGLREYCYGPFGPTGDPDSTSTFGELSFIPFGANCVYDNVGSDLPPIQEFHEFGTVYLLILLSALVILLAAALAIIIRVATIRNGSAIQ